ncbi:HlyD family secretion protein [Flavobacterium sp. '19STA2R22 D10 B1']|uniref:HlyD family secretion protein n=1 Tax=Flavobacterium aerium TaxID=3037261 RepID=UPI00278BEE8D|nr:HlyD family efflux transporter periplasmic adaptor subunit [Flavobacterium sp. '19STA2R22 D10 B1']
MPEDKKFELRSEEVQEILTRVPHWMIRWGNIVVLSIIVLMFIGSWLIKYPDIIATEVVITTNVPPEKLVAKTSGRIEAILVKDRQIVPMNTPLAVIENTANYEDVFLLKKVLDTIKLNRNSIKFPFELFRFARLGDIEGNYALFQKDFITNNLNRTLLPYQVAGRAQQVEGVELRERLHLLQQQKEINETELKLKKADLDRFEKLFNKGVISTQEYEAKKLSYLQDEKNFKTIASSISQLKSSLNDLNKNMLDTHINETKDDVILQSNVSQSFQQLRKAVRDWELAYVLTASIPGEVSFMQIWTDNQTIVAGENVFTVVPTDEKGYVGKVKAVAQNSGKIKVGQDVNIRLANFPDREFGMLKGKVKSISLTPDKDGNILIDIALPNKLETHYHKIIPFQQEMRGNAEIITEDLRLMERILYQFRDIFRR